MEALSYNHCCSGKAMNITYSEYVSVALVVQHSFFPARLYIIFFPHYVINDTIFEKKVIKHKICASSCITTFV